MKRKSLPTGRDFLFVEGYGNENPGAFQSPRPLRGATGDRRGRRQRDQNFNPRAPCGARRNQIGDAALAEIFQPTRPLRGATCLRLRILTMTLYFNPRAPCGARRAGSITFRLMSYYFNPRAPCGARRAAQGKRPSSCYFNPRAPCGARQQKCTNHYAHFCDNRQISDVFAQNADCQGILFLFCARKTCKF